MKIHEFLVRCRNYAQRAASAPKHVPLPIVNLSKSNATLAAKKVTYVSPPKEGSKEWKNEISKLAQWYAARNERIRKGLPPEDTLI